MRILTAVFIAALWAGTAQAAVVQVGNTGRVYPIAEPDFLEEVEQAARAADWNAIAAQARQSARQAARKVTPLPRAQETRTRLVDPTYELDMDIPDERGNIRFARGHRFNPLAYMPLERLYVWFDGNDRAQIEWYKTTPYYKDSRASVIITGGDPLALSRELGTSTYLANRQIIARMGVQVVPSIVHQQGEDLAVMEIYVPKKRGR